ncbi:carboxylesterase/lipase family protein [Actinocatenispora rupis]|uniref:Carboxylic ester hydrolase n=1 Tax=Actinocatenispora rupis TaxID=519421 RepID=A0A8J3J929_9ACTN|nr:carboxylesterase family protein [Actinocatenispora rupis]GID13951.1 carboxylic ester hydrolase [Actinocatenispora rupis]
MTIRSRLAAAGALGAALAGLLAVPAAATAGPTGTAGDPAVVTTDRGAVRGTVTADSRSYQGIPYAAAPVGELRWRSPRPAAAWTGVRDATRPGNACAQPTGLPVGVPSEHEDCLYLNVTAPARATGSTPVIVWIHGGSLMYGTGDMYGPARLSRDAVVVSMNYRLGVMGFLTDDALDGGSVNGSGSLGIEDQQAALRWVRRNIANFGGDPRNVTIMGQSGGGYSVCDQLASPTAAGLFDRAIVQSAPCTGDASRTRKAAEDEGTALAGKVGCADDPDRAACLRAVPASRLLAAYGTEVEPRPVAGTPLLPRTPGAAFAAGRFNRVPVLLTVNHDEDRGRVAGQELTTGTPLTAAGYEKAVRGRFGADADAVLAEYPLGSGDSPGAKLGDVLTDADWSTPTVDTAAALARWTPTRVAEFAEQDTPWYAGTPRVSFTVGAQHMSELAYLFDLSLFEKLTPAQVTLADRMADTWTRFAATGRTAWPAYTGTNRYVASIASGPWRRTDLAAAHGYRFWSQL